MIRSSHRRAAKILRALDAGPSLLLWSPAAAFAVYVKWSLLRAEGYRLVSLSLNRTAPAAPDYSGAFTLLERLSFFRVDLLFFFCLVPALLILAAVVRHKASRLVLVTAISLIFIAYLEMQLRAFNAVGRFVPLSLAFEGLEWAWRVPAQARHYVSARSLIRIPLLVGALAGLLTLLWKKEANVSVRQVKGAIAVPLMAAALSTGGWLSGLPHSAFHTNVLSLALSWDDGPEDVARLSNLPLSDLRKEYQRRARAPEPAVSPAHWGTARDYDVVLFILETAPAQCAPADRMPREFRTLSSLESHSWVALEHHTTYPNTTRAHFSLLSAQYAPEVIRELFELKARRAGFIQSLRASGYVTALYGTSSAISGNDVLMYDQLGFERIVVGDRGVYGTDPLSEFGLDVTPEENRDWDKNALRKLQEDIERWSAQDQRFAAVYVPQIGHAPWLDRDHTGEQDPIAICRSLVALQDEWLGELVETLKKAGRFDRTIIAVTGDHGFRATEEDPSLRLGMVDEHSFHVPLLLYAPGISSGERVPWVTSHIDVGPSILDLLGIGAGREFEQGTAIWDARLKDRRTYFWARSIMGAQGYTDGGRFFMWNRASDTVFANDGFHFDDRNIVAADSSVHAQATAELIDMDAIRYAWLRLGFSSQPRSSIR